MKDKKLTKEQALLLVQKYGLRLSNARAFQDDEGVHECYTALTDVISGPKADRDVVLAAKARSKYEHPKLAGSQRLKPQVQVISEFKKKTDAFRSDPSILNSLAQAPFGVLLREAMLLKACLGQPGVYLQMQTFLKNPTSKLPDEILDKILKCLLLPGISEKLIPKAGSTTVSSADLGATTAALSITARGGKKAENSSTHLRL